MNADSPTGPSLQFDTAVPPMPVPPDSRAGLSCASCSREMADEYFDVGGQSICAACRDELARSGETPRDAGTAARALLFGLGAALLGAILYYAVIALANLEIGIVAIAIGYMVGYAIRTATAGRGGRRFQVMAVVLTYWAVGLAYLPLVIQAGAEAEETAASAPVDGTNAQTADSTVTAAAAPAAPAASGDDDGSAGWAVVLLAGLTLALPIMVIVGSLPGGLLSAAIIGFGMHQAWQMTRSHQVPVTGPYRVAPPV